MTSAPKIPLGPLRERPGILRPLSISWLERQQSRMLLRVNNWRVFNQLHLHRTKRSRHLECPWQSYRRKQRVARPRRWLDPSKFCFHAHPAFEQVRLRVKLRMDP
jgi:hypothetical protein